MAAQATCSPHRDPSTGFESLFVYGTLRRELAHPMRGLLARFAQPIGMARYAGRLYDLGAYPGVVPQPNAPATVIGELYRLREPDVLWHGLDRYEGCTDPGDARAEYRREPQRVIREAGAAVMAWVYLYDLPTHALRRIECGDYLRYLQQRQGAARHDRMLH